MSLDSLLRLTVPSSEKIRTFQAIYGSALCSSATDARIVRIVVRMIKDYPNQGTVSDWIKFSRLWNAMVSDVHGGAFWKHPQ